jgi:hypothetical protein
MSLHVLRYIEVWGVMRECRFLGAFCRRMYNGRNWLICVSWHVICNFLYRNELIVFAISALVLEL